MTTAPNTEGPQRRALLYDLKGWDGILLAATALLISFGLVMVFSASAHKTVVSGFASTHFLSRQVLGVGLGAVVSAVILFMPQTIFRRLPLVLYWASLGMMLLVESPLGVTVKGAQRWIRVGGLRLQPSEYAKVAFCFIIAHHLSKNERRLQQFPRSVGGGAMWLAPIVFFMGIQKDFGSVVVVSGLFMLAMLAAGVAWRFLVGIGAGVSALFAFLIALEPYRIERIRSAFDPLKDCEDGSYQICEGWTSLSSGEYFGQGLAQGMGQYGFIPEAHNDMIMAVVGEDLGVVGWLLVFLLHGVILWRGVEISTQARTLYEAVLGFCVTSLIAMQAIINTMVVGGLAPPKGLVLPFMSYGGTAIVAHIACIAVLLRIHLNTRALQER